MFQFGSFDDSVDDNLLRLSYFGITNPILAEKISNAFPQVKESTRINTQQNFNVHAPTLLHGSEIFFTYIRKDERISFLEQKVAYAERNLFSFFSLLLIRGNAGKIFGANPVTMVALYGARTLY